MHVLDVMESIASSAASGKAVPIATTFALSDLLPKGWNPLQKSI
jgi:hypothetical protein